MKKCLLLMAAVMSMATASPRDNTIRVTLDGEWLFRADSTKAGREGQWYLPDLDRAGWQTVQLPAFWESFPGLATYDGWGWFVRRVVVSDASRPLSLHFAGVDDDAVVWVNGKNVGEHTGYGDPFVVDVSAAVKTGENLVAVLVKDYAGGGGIYRPVTLIETLHLEDLLKSPFFGKPARPSAEWVKDAVIYSVYLRSFSPEGTFAGLQKRVPELKHLGVTVLWLLPIHPVGVKNRKGTLGSPYAVRDYYGINPEFGTMDDFKRLLSTVHRHGMKLIIDLVANHTSWDSRLMSDHPEWFTRDSLGTVVPPNADWTDVADLDYAQPGLRRSMIDMMRWWVKDIGIDGFRCDVAELVPTDFWNEARRALDAIKPVMMLSEGSLPEHHAEAFDISYSWNVYDALDPLLQGKRPVTLIDQILRNEYLQFPTGSLRLRFTTNHDKNAWDAPAVLKFGRDGLALSTVLVNTMAGVPLIYTGEEVANDRKLSLFEKVDIDWSRPREMEQLYRTLFNLRKSHPVVSRGTFVRAETSDESVYAFVRRNEHDALIVVLNFSHNPRTIRLRLPFGSLFPGKPSVTVQELFNGSTLRLSADAVSLRLPPLGYRVYMLMP